jgi:SNF2 family DNA or RNA helicase
MLHVLLRGICLRRNEKYLEMPEPCYKEIKLTLSIEEKILYDGVLKRFQDDLDNLVSTQSKTKKYAILFAMVMKLRRLCNHGTMIMTNQLSSVAALDLDSESFCDYCQGHQEDNLATLNEDQVCPECRRIISASPQRPAKSALAVSQTSVTNSPISIELMVDQTLPSNLPSPGSMVRKISTKLAAVVENLKIEIQDSKR